MAKVTLGRYLMRGEGFKLMLVYRIIAAHKNAMKPWLLILSFWLVINSDGWCLSQEKTRQSQRVFTKDAVPFFKKYCYSCHGGKEPEAELSLEKFRQSAQVQQHYETWEKVLRMVNEGQMPPEGEPRPSAVEVQKATRAILAELATFDCGQDKHPGCVTIRRLNRAEYNNTIRDLVGVDFRPADDFPSDDVGAGFDNIADVLSMPPLLLEKYLDAAEKVIEKAFENPQTRKRILPQPSDNGADSRRAARQSLRRFARRAFRRPVTDDEMDRLLSFTRSARRNGSSREESLKMALQAILVSPHFLFRIERDGLAEVDLMEGNHRRLNDYEIATRLSYFLWSSMPDERLFSLAEKKTLHTEEVLQAEVRRMLKDPKAKALTENFAGQWLQLRDLPQLTPDPQKFPQFDAPLRLAMIRETEMVFEAIVREDRSVLDFLTADFSFVNERLARHYGMKGVQGESFQRVKLPSGRRGVLTHGGILLITSNPTRTSPVKRGKWVLDNLLGEPPPPPPAGVEELEEAGEELGTLRERMEQHRSNETCAVCHRKMDALGFGLENFDAVGAWRVRDGKFKIDASGELPGGLKFNGPADLVKILAGEKKEEFCRCLAQKMLIYALGRGLTSYDRCAVDAILARMKKNDYRFNSLVLGVVLSEPFLLRELKKVEK